MKHIERMHARELKKGSAELLILSLVETRQRHGYELGKLIESRSGGALRFSAAGLYPLLYRLEKRGWLEGRWIERASQRRRRYYRMTPYGREVAQLEAARLERAAGMARAKRLLPRRGRA